MEANNEAVSLCDEHLIQAYRNGVPQCLVSLIIRYFSVIDQRVRLYDYPNTDPEDVHQEALIALLRAADSFSLERDVLFSTYARRCIDNSIKNSLAKLNTNKAKILSQAYSINRTPERDCFAMPQNNPEQIYIDKEQYYFLRALLDVNLSTYEKKVFFCYLGGRSYQQIARSLGSSPKAVDNALQRVRKKLKVVVGNWR